MYRATTFSMLGQVIGDLEVSTHARIGASAPYEGTLRPSTEPHTSEAPDVSNLALDNSESGAGQQLERLLTSLTWSRVSVVFSVVSSVFRDLHLQSIKNDGLYPK